MVLVCCEVGSRRAFSEDTVIVRNDRLEEFVSARRGVNIKAHDAIFLMKTEAVCGEHDCAALVEYPRGFESPGGAIDPEIDAAVTLAPPRSPPVQGDEIEYWINLVHGSSRQVAGDIVVEHHPAAQLVITSYCANRGRFDRKTGLWEIGSMGLQGVARLRIKGRLTGDGRVLIGAEVVHTREADIDSVADNQAGHADDYLRIEVR